MKTKLTLHAPIGDLIKIDSTPLPTIRNKGRFSAPSDGGRALKLRNRREQLWTVAVLLMAVPALAHAGPIENAVDWVVTLLTSGIARGTAIVALAVCGYRAWTGRMTWEVVFQVLIGIVFVFGGATLVDTFSSAVGT